MIRSLLRVGLVAALLLPAPAFAQSSDAQHMATVIESLGCVVTSANESQFQERLGMSSAALEAAGNELLNAGQLQLRDNTLVFVGGTCADVATPASAADETLVAVMTTLRDNGCVVVEAEADAVLGPLGPRAVIMQHLRDLDEARFVHISHNFGGVVAADRLCEASDEVMASFAAQVPDMLALSSLNRLTFTASRPGARLLQVEWLVAQGCEVPHEDATQGMEAFGFDNVVAAVTLPLLNYGILQSTETHLILSPELCAASPENRRAAVHAMAPGDAALD